MKARRNRVSVDVFYFGNTVMAFQCVFEKCPLGQLRGCQVNLDKEVTIYRVPTKHRLTAWSFKYL